jgi:hypothetical protein
VKVSSEFGDAYRADLVRIIHGDANPDKEPDDRRAPL